jgi:hypothetical protein
VVSSLCWCPHGHPFHKRQPVSTPAAIATIQRRCPARAGQNGAIFAKIAALKAEIDVKVHRILQRCNFSALLSMLFLGRRERGTNVRPHA